MVSAGYAISSKAAIKARTSSGRINGYARLCLENNAWYTFLSASTAVADNDSILMPDDEPPTGRWIKSSGAGGGISGKIICTDNCPSGGGRVLAFFQQGIFQFQITPTLNLRNSEDITSGSDSIQVHRWNQYPGINQDDPPHSLMLGRQLVSEMSEQGGTSSVIITEEFRWISIFARDPYAGDIFRAVPIELFGNKIFLRSRYDTVDYP